MSFRILCISHDASLTGAPRVLLHFVRWVHAQQLAEVEVLLQEGGPLASQFASLVPTVQLPLEGWRRYFHPFAWLRERRNGLTENIALQRERVGKGAYDLVLANTVASGAAVAALAPFRSPLICWVHELEQMIARVERQRSFSTILHHCDRFVAASQAVKNNLLQCHALPTEQVAVAHEFVQCEEVTPAQRSRFSRELHQEIGAPPEALIVGGCGTTDWRKGPDLFLEVAAEVVRLRPNAPVHFVWLGGNPFRQWPSEIRQGLPPPQRSRRIHFLGQRAGAENIMAAFDIFALTSREDPYPLVMLEAANQGLPIVCFRPSGGAVEFVEDDSGIVVPDFDSARFAQAVLALVDNPTLRSQYGNCAQAKVRQRHTVPMGAAHLWQTLCRLAALPQ